MKTPGREHHDGRVGPGLRGRGPQGFEQLSRVELTTGDPVAGEQLGEDAGHHPPVLDDVGDARRASDVVLENAEPAVSAPDHVDPGDVDPHPVGRVDPERRTVEVLGRGDQTVRKDAVLQYLALAVQVGEESLQGLDPLCHPRSKDLPLVLRDHPRDEVEGERALLAGQLECDPPVAKGSVSSGRAQLEVVGRERLQGFVEAPGGLAAGRRKPRTSRPTRVSRRVPRGCSPRRGLPCPLSMSAPCYRLISRAGPPGPCGPRTGGGSALGGPGARARAGRVAARRRARSDWSSTTLRILTVEGVTSTHSSSLMNSSACSNESCSGGTRRTVSSAAAARMLVCFFSLVGIDVHVLGAGVLADDHPLVDLDAGADEKGASLLQVGQGVGGGRAAAIGDHRPVGAGTQLAVPRLVALEHVVELPGAPRLGQELGSEADEAPRRHQPVHAAPAGAVVDHGSPSGPCEATGAG